MTKFKYVTRAVTVIDFSNPRKIQLPEIYQVQSCVIKLEHTLLDIGSNCYDNRSVDKNGHASTPIKNIQGIRVICVELDSIDESRVELLQHLVRYAAHYTKSHSQKTIETRIKGVLAFLRFYWNQADLNYSQPENRGHFEEAARRHSANLNANKKTCRAYKYQRTRIVFEFAEFIYDNDRLDAFDYDIIQSQMHLRKGTTPLLPEERELALSLRYAIFETVFDLLINKKTLPYPLVVPDICKEPNNIIWLGYSPWAGFKAFPRSADFKKHKPKEWFDREKGEFMSKEQIEKQGPVELSAFRNELKSKNLDHSNTRQNLAEYACLCFFDLLLSMTGLNQQPALDLPWFGGYFSQRAGQGYKRISLVSTEDQSKLECVEDPNTYLRAIKSRKGYQSVEVIIINRFIPYLKKYFQLREYYLNGESDVRLFPFSARMVQHRRNHLYKAFPEIPKLGSRLARAGVSDSILTKVNNPEVAAIVLQNDLKTVIKSYAVGTQQAHIEGMGGFLNSLDKRIKLTRKVTKTSIETGVGSCSQGGTSPAPSSDAPFELDCSQQEGCFFCEHYSVHADETDVRKLFSVLYYITKGAIRASDIDHFNYTFGPVIEQINNMLKKIENISSNKKRLISRIKDEVFLGEKLDDYWLYKLNRLERLTGDH